MSFRSHDRTGSQWAAAGRWRRLLRFISEREATQLSDDELRFLTQVRRFSASLNDSDRKLVIAMVKKMAMK